MNGMNFCTQLMRGMWLVVAILSFSISACDSHSSHQLRIGTNVWPGYEPLYLARELGYLKSDQFQLIEHTSASQVIRSYRNGAIDMAALTMDEVLLLKENGFDPRVILVMDISHGGDVIISQPGIQSFFELKGKTVGVEKTALGAYVLSRALELNGMAAGDVLTKHLEHAFHDQAFTSKEIDAVVTFEPVKTRLVNSGANIVFDSSMMPDEIVDVLVVRGDILDEHSADIASLVETWFTTLEYFKKNPDRSAQLMAPRLAIEPADVLASYDGLVLPGKRENQVLLSMTKGEGKLAGNTRKLVDAMLAQKTLKTSVNTLELFKDVSTVHDWK